MKNYILIYNEFFDDVQTKFDELTKELSDIDLQMQDLLHFIESEKYNGATGSKVLKLLKQCRVKRRIIKDELAHIDKVRHQLKSKVKVDDSKIYKYRTDVLNDLNIKKGDIKNIY